MEWRVVGVAVCTSFFADGEVILTLDLTRPARQMTSHSHSNPNPSPKQSLTPYPLVPSTPTYRHPTIDTVPDLVPGPGSRPDRAVPASAPGLPTLRGLDPRRAGPGLPSRRRPGRHPGSTTAAGGDGGGGGRGRGGGGEGRGGEPGRRVKCDGGGGE